MTEEELATAEVDTDGEESEENGEVLVGTLGELASKYYNLVDICKRMENPRSIADYNPNHPATWSRVKAAKYPCGELRRLVAQMAIEKPERMKGFRVPSESEWQALGDTAKRIAKAARGQDPLELANRWELYTWMDARGPKL